MNKLIFSLIICLSFSTAHALTYEQAETYSVCGVALTTTDTVAESTGNIVTSPDTHLGLPDGTPVYVPNMDTSGLGPSGEAVDIIEQLRTALHENTDKNDLMHWYVTAGADVVYCTPNSFRCVYDSNARTSVVLGLWLPREANEITVQFTTISKQLSIAIYTYDYETDTFLSYESKNNSYQNSQGGVYTFSETYEAGYKKSPDTYTGQYLFLMFNTSQGEKQYIDINGMGVSYTPVDPEETPDVGEYAPIFPGYVPPAEDGGNTTVPESSGAMLSLLALATLAARRRRR